jgi:hypothetical protein
LLKKEDNPKKVHKQESKLWQAAFGMNKNEVVQFTREELRRYMTNAHFNMSSV